MYQSVGSQVLVSRRISGQENNSAPRDFLNLPSGVLFRSSRVAKWVLFRKFSFCFGLEYQMSCPVPGSREVYQTHIDRSGDGGDDQDPRHARTVTEPENECGFDYVGGESSGATGEHH